MISVVIGTAFVGPVQAALSAGAGRVEADVLRAHLTSMVTAYFYKMSV
jgi:hypothetical protein